MRVNMRLWVGFRMVNISRFDHVAFRIRPTYLWAFLVYLVYTSYSGHVAEWTMWRCERLNEKPKLLFKCKAEPNPTEVRESETVAALRFMAPKLKASFF